jgi:hypothetical protein
MTFIAQKNPGFAENGQFGHFHPTEFVTKSHFGEF